MVNDSFNISDSSAFELVRYASVQISTDKIINPGQSCWLELCDDVAQVTNQQLLPAQIWTEFKTIFYQQWQFAIAADHYFSMTSSNLFSLMIDRQSNNTLMAIVVVELLKSLKLDL